MQSSGKSFNLVLAFLLIARALPAANCGVTSVGKTPLNDLGPGMYQGYQGGLYPGGLNAVPAAHLQNFDRTSRVQLLNTAGTPDAATGRIVLLSIGMSNTTQEYSAFMPLANGDPQKNSRLVLVDGAQGGMDATKISDPANPSFNTFWSTVNSRITAAGVTPEQVEVVWLKEAIGGITGAFPADAIQLQNDLKEIVRIIKSRYANTKIVYLSSRIYAGYASSTLNPEPYSYQSGFSVKWLIEQQISGDPSLNFDPAKGPVLAPWLAWGPYMWADGTTPRSDGLTWICTDFQSDGTHPSSPQGQSKVASTQLLPFFKNNATATPWFLDCNTSDPSVFARPPGILNLKLAKGSGTALQLAWDSLDPVAGAGTMYDIVGGDLLELQVDGGFTRAACRVNSLADTPYTDAAPPGGSLWYQLRGRNSCGNGSYGAAGLDTGGPNCP